MTQFAGIAGRIEAVIGPKLTAKLLAARGGTRITIPTRARGSALAQLIGLEATDALRRSDDPAFGPGTLKLPLASERGRGAARRAAIEMLRKGASLTEVALTAGVDRRTASRWRETLDSPEPSLGPLFELADARATRRG